MLARFWKDFQNFWDIYITIALSILFFILGLFGLPGGVIASLTLVVLGTLAGSLRRQREIETGVSNSLHIISQDIQGMSQNIHGLVTNQVFEEQEIAYQFLCRWIEDHDAKKAVLFQYSCNTSMGVVRALMRKGAHVTIYVQHEETATRVGSTFQAERIISKTQSLKMDLGRSLSRPDQLKLYKYHSPATISAVKIDDHVLCMGWYLYEEKDQDLHQGFKKDTTEVSAHDIATVIAFEGTIEYGRLLKTFQMQEENFQKHAEEIQL